MPRPRASNVIWPLPRTRLNPSYEQASLAGYRNTIRGQENGGVWAAPTAIDLTQGTLQQTSDPHDVALDGAGFFTVAGPKATDRLLTRDGRFLVNEAGTLVMATGGSPVLDSKGQKITLNPAIPFTISNHGEIQQAGTTVGQLGLANANAADLEKLGGNLLTVKPGAQTTAIPAGTQVRQKLPEESGVDPTVEMVNMLEGQRVFEANAKMIQYQDTMMGLLNGVGKIA